MLGLWEGLAEKPRTHGEAPLVGIQPATWRLLIQKRDLNTKATNEQSGVRPAGWRRLSENSRSIALDLTSRDMELLLRREPFSIGDAEVFAACHISGPHGWGSIRYPQVDTPTFHAPERIPSLFRCSLTHRYRLVAPPSGNHLVFVAFQTCERSNKASVFAGRSKHRAKIVEPLLWIQSKSKWDFLVDLQHTQM